MTTSLSLFKMDDKLCKRSPTATRCKNNSLPIPLFVSSFYPATNGGSLWNPCRLAGWVRVLIVSYNWRAKGFLRKFVLLCPLISFFSLLSSHFLFPLLPNVPNSTQSVTPLLTCPVLWPKAQGAPALLISSFWGQKLNHNKKIQAGLGPIPVKSAVHMWAGKECVHIVAKGTEDSYLASFPSV